MGDGNPDNIGNHVIMYAGVPERLKLLIEIEER